MTPELFQINFEIEFKHWWFRARRQILCSLIHELLPPSPDHVLLEVGCGTGGNIGVLGAEYTCIGLDASAEALELAKERFPAIQYHCGVAPEAVDAVEAVAGHADLYLLADVLEHVRDDRGLLSSLIRTARDGAYLVIAVPAEMMLWSAHDEAHGHFRRYDRKTLPALWQGLPVEPLLVSSFNARLFPLVALGRMVGRWFARSWGPRGTDLMVPPARINRFLERVFAGEGPVLCDVLRQRLCRGYRWGSSMIAVLRKTQAAASHRTAGRRAA